MGWFVSDINSPDEITVEFKHERRVTTSFFYIEIPDSDFIIEEVTANTVHRFLDSLDDLEREKAFVTYWIPSESRLGHSAQYRINGKVFMQKAKLKNIGD